MNRNAFRLAPNIGRVIVAVTLAWFALGGRAMAIPYFAHEYGFKCQKCHSVIPRLNAFGGAFMREGYQLPGARPDRAVVPLSFKVNAIYGSDPGPGEPKAVVDEVEAYLAGTAGPRLNYFAEQYLVNGGRPGALRELWLSGRLTGDRAPVPLWLTGGSFTLPLPVDPETFRESYADYAPFVSTVGADPFTFKDAKAGLMARVGRFGSGLSATVAALQGHDQESGIPSQGIDLMQTLQDGFGPATVSIYRYAGTRPIGGGDRFYRQGYAAVVESGRYEADVVVQQGYDSATGFGADASSSGGFGQLRYQISQRYFVLGRYEGTNDPLGGRVRDIVALGGMRLGRNARLTLEDVLAYPRVHSTVTSQLTIGY